MFARDGRGDMEMQMSQTHKIQLPAGTSSVKSYSLFYIFETRNKRKDVTNLKQRIGKSMGEWDSFGSIHNFELA